VCWANELADALLQAADAFLGDGESTAGDDRAGGERRYLHGTWECQRKREAGKVLSAEVHIREELLLLGNRLTDALHYTDQLCI
jgi:hypothetical protein